MVKSRYIIISLLLFVIFIVPLYSEDVIKLTPGQSESDHRHYYPHQVLKAALDATVVSHGSYAIKYTDQSMSRNRALISLEEGSVINVHSAPTRREWEERTIPIRFPIRKGILSYRLLLINEKDSEIFNEIKTIEELKRLKAGLGSQWSTTEAMSKADFTIVKSNDYESLFRMLEAGRFDYFPRGVNEIFEEYEIRKSLYPQMVIEDSLVLYLLTPTYLFVSPKRPDLADRINAGLNEILENGIFESLFLKEFEDRLKLSDLESRRILTIENTDLSPETPLQNQSLWYSIPD